MGNCCVYKASPASSSRQNGPKAKLYMPENRGVDGYHPNGNGAVEHPKSAAVSEKQQSSSNLQHISEREPDDTDGDPSVHPKTSTLFIRRSASDTKHKNHKRRKSHYDNHNHLNEINVSSAEDTSWVERIIISINRDYGRMTRKFSSCSTIFIDNSTVSQPNLKNTIRAVALAIYFHIKNRERRDEVGGIYQGQQQSMDDSLPDIFDEKLHPLAKEPVPDDYARRDPEHKTIYRFIRNLFHSAQLTAECAIVTLVYLERLLTYGDMEIVPGNWKRIVLGAILLASKVWDDQAVWNVDYCQILKEISVEDMNELERQFLEMLQFNINVPSSVYAKYYFDLRALADAHDLSFPSEPLSKDRAVKLEAMSNLCEDRLRQSHYTLRRSHSLDGFTGNPRLSKAILS